MTSQLPLFLLLAYTKSSAAELPLFWCNLSFDFKAFFLFDCDEPDNNTRITRITDERLTFSCRRFLFDLTLCVPSTIFQLNRDGSSWVEPVLSLDKCDLLKDHNAVTQ